MIIERNVFHLKYGKAKEAIAIWKEVMDEAKKVNLPNSQMRLLSDISGPAYTLVMEIHIPGYIEINPKNAVWATHPKFQELHQKFIPLCEKAHREYYKIECII